MANAYTCPATPETVRLLRESSSQPREARLLHSAFNPILRIPQHHRPNTPQPLNLMRKMPIGVPQHPQKLPRLTLVGEKAREQPPLIAIAFAR
ncbi:hypothetical protein LTR91_026655, partial [Friedmanniomyces endolithicus]